MKSKSNFMGWVFRMRFIKRWNRVDNQKSTDVDLHSHCLNVAVVSHLLAEVGNAYHGENYNAERISLLGLYHEFAEVVTGDSPPIKYASEGITQEVKRLEDQAESMCVQALPEKLQAKMATFIIQKDISKEEKALVKAADDIVALSKAKEEVTMASNFDFTNALDNLQGKVNTHADNIPAVKTYLSLFKEGYSETIDHLMNSGH